MENKKDAKIELEQAVSEALTDGEMEKSDPKLRAQQQLPPKYEIRIQTELDPIVEETKIIRSMAKEMDNRYDKYLNRLPASKRNTEEADSANEPT